MRLRLCFIFLQQLIQNVDFKNVVCSKKIWGWSFCRRYLVVGGFLRRVEWRSCHCKKYGSFGTTVFMPRKLDWLFRFFSTTHSQIFIEDPRAGHHFRWWLYIGVQDKVIGSLGNNDLEWWEENHQDQRKDHLDERKKKTKSLKAGMSLYDERECCKTGVPWVVGNGRW